MTMKCKACPLHLLCVSGSLNLASCDTYVCLRCERFFVKNGLLIMGLNGFVCEFRSAFMKKYKRMLKSRHKFIPSIYYILDGIRLTRDPVIPHKMLKIKWCDTCDNYKRVQYTWYARKMGYHEMQ